jgi:hypothetical protein
VSPFQGPVIAEKLRNGKLPLQRHATRMLQRRLRPTGSKKTWGFGTEYKVGCQNRLSKKSPKLRLALPTKICSSLRVKVLGFLPLVRIDDETSALHQRTLFAWSSHSVATYGSDDWTQCKQHIAAVRTTQTDRKTEIEANQGIRRAYMYLYHRVCTVAHGTHDTHANPGRVIADQR